MDHLLSKGKVARPDGPWLYELKKSIGTGSLAPSARYLPSFERPGASQPQLFENRILH